MVTVLLIRHATCDHVGERIAGRAPGVHLNARGRAEAEALARALPPGRVGAIYSGPLERAVETAETLARRLGLTVRAAPGLDELDFGEWTGRTLASLDGEPRWQAFNRARSTTRIPGGELMQEAADRAAVELDRLERTHPGARVAAVSHGDVIRALLLRCLAMPLDAVHRLEVAPASVSVVEWSAGGGKVSVVNWTTDAP
ncbi:MAG: histidine phosphatase family protein [Gemmatimonadales bacterium]